MDERITIGIIGIGILIGLYILINLGDEEEKCVYLGNEKELLKCLGYNITKENNKCFIEYKGEKIPYCGKDCICKLEQIYVVVVDNCEKNVSTNNPS